MKPANRIVSIDAARGTAMFFVFLAHFITIYFRNAKSDFAHLLSLVAMVATPTFITISGLMLGFLYQMNREKSFEIKLKLIDRGLFLIMIGHLLIALAHIRLSSSLYSSITKWEFMTDTIGFCLILGPLIIDKMKVVNRLSLVLSVYLVSWLMILFVHPDNLGLRVLKDVFFGSLGGNVFYYNFPLFPWFSFYFLNSYVGEKMAIYYLRKEEGKILNMLLMIACFCLGLAICAIIGYYFLNTQSLIFYVLGPHKLPPSPSYLLAYGGVGYFILFILFKFRNMWIINGYSKIMSVLGRNSLFAFVLQYYVYFVIMHYVDLPYSIAWPVYFIMSAFFIIVIANMWDQNNLNRFITLGLTRLFRDLRTWGRLSRNTV